MSSIVVSNNEKVAIITGASQGIGAGLARAYRELGYAVIATARSIGPSEDPGIVPSRATSPTLTRRSASWTRRSSASAGSTP